MGRVTFETASWFGGRFKATILVDMHAVEKAFFATRDDALTWCLAKQFEYAAQVR